jgi:hypothetical protein
VWYLLYLEGGTYAKMVQVDISVSGGAAYAYASAAGYVIVTNLVCASAPTYRNN